MAHLFEPIRLGSITLANRIMVSPMSQYSATDGEAGLWHLVHYGALSNSGAGLAMIEATHVDMQGKGTMGCLGLFTDAQEQALASVVAAAKALGQSRIGLQLNHSGRKASMSLPWAETRASLPEAEGGWQTLSASAIPFGADWQTPEAATAEDLERLVKAFVASAERAARIGIDVLEIHAAHGYLLHSFLTPLANTRTDAYGGSRENRMRFPLEVIGAVRKVWTGPLGVKVSSSDWDERGADLEDALAFCAELEALGCDYVVMSSGAATADIKVPVKPDYQLGFAEAAKGRLSIPVFTVGLMYDPKHTNALIEAGRADGIAVARGFLDNPHWAYAAANVLGQEVVRPKPYAKCGPTAWPGAKMRA